MKRRAAYFLLCVCFCFSTLSLSSSAVEYDDYTGEEVLYNAEEDYYYSLAKPLEYDPFSLFASTTKSFPDFDISKLPWIEMPTYVQEILYGQPQGNTSSINIEGTYKVPFVLCIVSSSEVHVIAGWNLSIGMYFRTQDELNNGSCTGVFIVSRKSVPSIYQHSAAYHAYYKTSDYSLKQAWSNLEGVAVGDNFVRYAEMRFPDAGYSRDYYCYGFNGYGPGMLYLGQKIYATDDDQWPQYRFVGDPVVGFASGKFIYHLDWFTNGFFAFTPPTAEQQSASTSKGIWETLKEIPQNIANSFRDFFLSLQINIRGFFTSLGDRISGFFTSLGDRISGFFDNLANKIKSFFLPSEDFFNTYTADFISYFSDCFGLLYELPDAVIDILQQFIDYSPAESGYSITFPEVVMPVLDNGEWYDKVIIEETDITFEFLEQGAFKTLYSMYRSVIWMIFIFALINLIIRKSERVFGG